MWRILARAFQTVGEHFETWLDLARAGQFDGQGDSRAPKPFVRQSFRKFGASWITSRWTSACIGEGSKQ
jgi:hypothetical protein